MKVQELIKKLLEFDPELEVMFEDNEYGESEINQVTIEVRPDYSKLPIGAIRHVNYVSLK